MRGAPLDGAACREPLAGRVWRALIAERIEQGGEFVVAAMHITDNVERAVIMTLVGPERHARDRDRIHLLRRAHHGDMAKTLPCRDGADPAAAPWHGYAAHARRNRAPPAPRCAPRRCADRYRRRRAPAGHDGAAPARRAAPGRRAARKWRRSPSNTGARARRSAIASSTAKASCVAD